MVGRGVVRLLREAVWRWGRWSRGGSDGERSTCVVLLPRERERG